MKELDLDKEQAPKEMDSRYGLLGPAFARFSKASSLKELPSFLGDFDSDDDMRRVPMHYKPSLVILDSANLQVLLSTPIKVSLPLAKVLKVRPKMRLEIMKFLKRMGVELPPCKNMSETIVANSIKGVKCDPIPLNKVGN